MNPAKSFFLAKRGKAKVSKSKLEENWFIPVTETEETPAVDSETLFSKVKNITTLVSFSDDDKGREYFEGRLLTHVEGNSEEPAHSVLLACQQIVDCLFNKFLNQEGELKISNERFIGCLATLYSIAKVRPHFLLQHVDLLHHMIPHSTREIDKRSIDYVGKILKLVLPLIEKPSGEFVSLLEETVGELICNQTPTALLSCASSMTVVVNVTDYQIMIVHYLEMFYDELCKLKRYLENNGEQTNQNNRAPKKRCMEVRKNLNADVKKQGQAMTEVKPNYRSIDVLAVLMRYFHFNGIEFRHVVPHNIARDVLHIFFSILHQNKEMKLLIVKAIGQMCIRHCDLMLTPPLNNLYHQVLKTSDASSNLKIQVLINIRMYLEEGGEQLAEQDQQLGRMMETEDVEMMEVSSNMPNSVIQEYLDDILDSYVHPEVAVRKAVQNLIKVIVSQGIVDPITIIPTLICMCSDPNKEVSWSAEKQLWGIDAKTPGSIHTKAMDGINLTFQLHNILQKNSNTVTRGFQHFKPCPPVALNALVYSFLHTKQQKRALIDSILKQFEKKENTSLSKMLFLADTLAYLPYREQDEPLYTINEIKKMVLATSDNFEIPPRVRATESEDESDDGDEETLLAKVLEQTLELQHYFTANIGWYYLLVELKRQLKSMFDFNHRQVKKYCTAESSKAWETPLVLKADDLFDPKLVIDSIQQASSLHKLYESTRATISNNLDISVASGSDRPEEEDGKHRSASPEPSTSQVTHPDAVQSSNYEQAVNEAMSVASGSDRPVEEDGKQRSASPEPFTSRVTQPDAVQSSNPNEQAVNEAETLGRKIIILRKQLLRTARK
ncbi:nipped-B-like protein isoform X2 [Nilaparvata lugens]|nr:nipped-B-like protein isoform X2 [Nilaparvata lugens]XP_039298504.1 nipped-B-like protein isoform X2 [Nilaparvata lugens]